MNCFRVRKRLMEYAEAELGFRRATPLPEHLMKAIEAHLERCTTCCEEAEAIRDSFTIADMAGEMEPSAAFKVRTVKLLTQEKERSPVLAPFGLRFRPALVYPVLLVAIVVLLAVFLPDHPERVELAAGIGEFEEQIDRYARDIEFLAGTLSESGGYEPESHAERAQLDRIVLLASSIDECWNAFEKNPENERIRTLLLTQMGEEVDALKSFYEVRSL